MFRPLSLALLASATLASVDSLAARREPKSGFTPHIVVPSLLQNHSRNVTWLPMAAYMPGVDIDELSETMLWIATKLPPKLKVKAGGSRLSNSPVAHGDGAYIFPDNLRFVEPVKHGSPSGRDLKTSVSDEWLFHVGSGTKIREINGTLWAAGGALPALGGYDGQTLGGVLTTGTHGSVFARGPLAELVIRIDMVKLDGSKVRIEPKDGITDPNAFSKEHPDWTLLQSDDVYDAALINMGTLGVVHSYVVRAREKFWLNEIRSVTTATKAKAILRGENVYRLIENDRPEAKLPRTGSFSRHPTPAFHLELLWNPYSDKIAVTSRHPVSAAKRAELMKKEPPAYTGVPNRNLLRAIFSQPKNNRPLGTELAAKLVGLPAAWAANQIGKLDPKTAVKFIDVAIDGLPDREYTQRSYNVFNIGDAANSLPVHSAEISVPVRGDKYLIAMDIIERTAKEQAEKHKLYETGPISIRFVKGSRALLGDHEDVARFEIIFSGNDKDTLLLAETMIAAYYVALEAKLGADVHFHWGQLIPHSVVPTVAKHIPTSFPRYIIYDRIRNEFDPEKRLMNVWQEKLLPTFAMPKSK